MPSLHQPIEALVGPLQFDVDVFRREFSRRELKRGDFWLREGKVCRKIAFVESGSLRHYRHHNDQQLTRWAALPGQFTTAMTSLTQEEPSEDNIVATEATVVYELDRDAWRRLRAEHPQLQAFWVALLEHTLVCFEDRVWSLIAGDAEARYHYMIERYPGFLLSLPQHFVADMLGIAPRHLSRFRAKTAGAD